MAGRGARASRVPVNPKSDTAKKTAYDARVEFKAYLAYHTDEISEFITTKKLIGNLDEFNGFSSDMTKSWISENIDKLVNECIEDGALVENGAGKYLFIGEKEA